jgi:hypothetical protein
LEPLASSPELPAYVESAEASEGSWEAGEGSGLGALLITLTPFALAAWFAIGLAVHRAIT